MPCRILDRRATEHYFTDAALKRVCGEKARALGPFEASKGKDAPNMPAKTENWRVAAAMSPDDLQGTDLGDFLDLVCADV